MTLRLIQGPAVEPVTLGAAKTHLRVTHDQEDALIEQYVRTARIQCEEILERSLITSVWERVLDAFPDREIELGMPPVIRALEVRYIRPDGTTTVLENTGYVLDDVREPGWLLPVGSWPNTLDTINAVRVRFEAGFGASPGDVPEPVRQWILVRAGDLYAHRESIVAGTLSSAPSRFLDGLLDPYRRAVV